MRTANWRQAVDDPPGYGRALKRESGKKIVGYLCSYVPEEIILAAGAHPYRIFGRGRAVRQADAHLQSYSCSLVRETLEDALDGALDFLDGVVFPHTCDSIQRLSDVWRLNVPGMFHLDVVFPVKLDTDSAREYLLAVLRKFVRDLEEKLSCRIGAAELQAAVRTMNRLRSLLYRAARLRAEKPGVVDGSELQRLFQAAAVAAREDMIAVLEERVAFWEAAPEPAAPSRVKRLVLTGSLCLQPDLYRIVAEAGGVVVWDDFCTGGRAAEGLLDETIDPLTALANRYIDRPLCPAKHQGLTSRGEHLLRLVRENRADGVVLLLLKFCDPHAFDVPYLREFLQKAGVPSLLVEIEDQRPAEGPLKTRFEAFIEML